MDAIERDDLFEELERLREEGKLRHYGVALGPAIGWRDEGLRAIDERRIASVQTVYNVLEQDPGRDFLEAGRAARDRRAWRASRRRAACSRTSTRSRRPFRRDDHRSHRPA